MQNKDQKKKKKKKKRKKIKLVKTLLALIISTCLVKERVIDITLSPLLELTVSTCKYISTT